MSNQNLCSLSVAMMTVIMLLYRAGVEGAMEWTLVQDTQAVCNDYSRAGFFIEKPIINSTSTKWVIFLESGGLCYSAETCNERFFKAEVRTEFSSNNDDSGYSFDSDFNLSQTWATLNSLNRSFSERINPYMTSLATYINDNQDFAQVDGRDFLDGSKQLNPMFYDFNRVVIPYCSSDMWLAEDDYVPDGVDLSSINPQKQFLDNVYSPEAETLQFTFRGQTILKGVIKQLLEEDVLSDATEILLAGSSAGGLGVVNNVKWIISELENNTVDANVSVLVDSSWFINFRGNIYRRFDGTLEGSESNTADRKDMRLFDLIDSVPQCVAVTPTGSPCCVSLECVLLDERYFPVGQIPVMVVFSLYDVFLLADAIAQQIPPGVTVNQQPSLGGEFILTIAEYGGAMNSSIIDTTPQVNGLSFIATQCFQHVYFATSTLWGTDNILGSSSTEQLNVSLGAFGGSFTHKIQSGVWNSYQFGDTNTTESCDPSKARTMQDAVNMWYRCRYNNNSLQFRDTCYSVHCHNSCPEEISLSDIETSRYPTWSRVVIICIVVFVTMLSIAAKIVFYVWELVLFSKQNLYLERIDDELVEEDKTDGAIPQFPTCDLDEAVSVACLDLKYSINFRKKKKVKDEKKDSTSISFAIAHHDEEEEDLKRKNSLRARIGKSFIGGSKRYTPKSNDPSKVQVKSDGPASENDKKLSCCYPFKSESKQILKGISLYFNPGELVGIMGPSGCGKTTFLDLLTGRRRTGEMQGDIFVNGVRIDLVRDEYISYTGYVLQLATPYYEELTVRDNITLAAQMKLPRTMSQREKFERVEQVIEVTGLKHVSETVVGGLSGPGLSGGQKKRLTIALQLLTMPKVIFLDEPTSGLDATAAIELLNHLNALASSNRTVVLTIHQPRFEIFYMFHKLILLSDGKAAYHGVPKNAYAFFVEALMSSFLRKNLILPQIEEQNPADVIMDMLGKPHFRQIILDHYQNSSEPNLIKWAIGRARVKDFESMSMASEDRNVTEQSSFIRRSFRRRSLKQKKFKHQKSIIISEEDFVVAKPANWFDRLSVLEARAGKRSSLIWRLYLPINFLTFGFVLGTVYYQQDDPLLIVTAFCVYSVASAIFMFPFMQTYFVRALEVYAYENADGAGYPSDIILQGFTRFTTLAFIPVIIGSVAVYCLSINMKFWSVSVFFQLVIVGMALNQTWIALLTSLICSVPSLAFRLSPVLSSVAGFTSGFFISISQTPWAYRWLFYINPNYYGFSASANILLANINNCEDGDSIVQCLVGSGGFILKRFNFDTIRPFMNIAILLLMTLLYLLLAIFSNWIRHTTLFSRLKVKLRSKHMDQVMSTVLSPDKNNSSDSSEQSPPFFTVSEKEINNGTVLLDEEITEIQPKHKNQSSVKRKWVMIATKAKEELAEQVPLEPRQHQQKRRHTLQKQDSIFADTEEHVVFKPVKKGDVQTPGTQFTSLINNIVAQNRQRSHDQQRQTLLQRQLQFNIHTNATKEVLKEQTEELVNKSDEFMTETSNFRNITFKLMNLKQQSNSSAELANGSGNSSEATTSNLLVASSALKWKQKATKIPHPENSVTSENNLLEKDNVIVTILEEDKENK